MTETINNHSRYFGIIDLFVSLLPSFLVKLIDKIHSFSIKNIFNKKKESVIPTYIQNHEFAKNPYAKIPSFYDLENLGQAYAAELYLLLDENEEFVGDGSLIATLPANEEHNEEKFFKLQRAKELWAKNETKDHISTLVLNNRAPYLLKNGKLVDEIPAEELEKKYGQEKMRIGADFARAKRISNIDPDDSELPSLLAKNPEFSTSDGKLVQEIPDRVFQAKREKIKSDMEQTLEKAKELSKKDSAMLTAFRTLQSEDIRFPKHFLNGAIYITTAWIYSQNKA